jgi:hypothetical protein
VPDGGCYVVHRGAVHERRPISLDHSQVNDAGTLLIVACERLGKCDGGMVAFSPASGELRHRFRVAHGRQAKSFTAGALAFDQDSSIFTSCKGPAQRVRHQCLGPHHRRAGRLLLRAPRLRIGRRRQAPVAGRHQRAHGVHTFPQGRQLFHLLLDFQARDVAWSWSDAGAAMSLDDKCVLHAIAMKDECSVCVIN